MSRKTKTTTTKEVGNPALTPKLRFPEFRESEEWEGIPIGDKVDLLSGYAFDGPDITQDTSGIRLLRGINVTEGRIRHNAEIDRYYTGATKGLEKFRLQTNDLVIGMDGSKVGKNSALVSAPDSGALLIQRVARLRANNQALIQFIFQHINSTVFHSYVNRINTSSGIPHISAKQIKDFEICFPSEFEQQKIAECLSSVDEVIAAQARKLDALKTHKKGLMQELFPREGETQPRLRFPEFQDAPEWGGEKLSSMVQLVSGTHLSPDQYGKEKGVPYFTGPSDFTNDIQSITKRTNESSGIAKENDTLITVKGSGVGTIWYLTLFSIAMGRQLMAIRATDGVSRFVYQFLLTKKSRFGDLASGNLIPGLSRGDILDLDAPITSTPEQQRVADCLTSLDNLISAQAQKLEALKTHKKGLMQQLFPSPEEEV